jgi:hypothetical protein
MWPLDLAFQLSQGRFDIRAENAETLNMAVELSMDFTAAAHWGDGIALEHPQLVDHIAPCASR